MWHNNILSLILILLTTATKCYGENESVEETPIECTVLEARRNSDKNRLEYKELTTHGWPKRVVVMSSSRAPSRAVASLLATAIKYRAGIEAVTTAVDNTTTHTINQLAFFVKAYDDIRYKRYKELDLYIHVDATWEKDYNASALPGCGEYDHHCSMAGTALNIYRESPSVNIRMHVVLNENAYANSVCKDSIYWSFYKDHSITQQCNFLEKDPTSKFIPVYIPNDIGLKSKEIENSLTSVSRHELDAMITQRNNSFLFIDYDLDYTNDKYVKIVYHNRFLKQEKALLVGEYRLFSHFCPNIHKILNKMSPQPAHLRQILNTRNDSYAEAACVWADKNYDTFQQWTPVEKIKFILRVVLCKNDPDKEKYMRVTQVVISVMQKEINGFIIKDPIFDYMDCKNPEAMSQILVNTTKPVQYRTQAGIAIPVTGADGAVDTSKGKDLATQVVFYEVPPAQTKLSGFISTISGRMPILAHAIRHFLEKYEWSRIAIISDTSAVAKSLTTELVSDKAIVYHEVKLENTTTSDIRKGLAVLKEKSAKIFFLNTGPLEAGIILCEAKQLEMTDSSTYVWIVREWRRPDNEFTADCVKDIRVFTISYWWRGGDFSKVNKNGANEGGETLRAAISKNLTEETWPILTAPLADALVLMIQRLKMMAQGTESLFDPHNLNFLNVMVEKKISVDGPVDKIELSNNTRSNPQIFVSEWKDKNHKLLAIWRGQSDNRKIIEENNIYEPFEGAEIPDDGKSRCITKAIGGFNPTCLDAIWPCLFIFIILLPVGIWKLHSMQKLKKKKREQEIHMRLLMRCEKTSALLMPHLVERSALELYEELGSGHFGRVRFGMLRLRNKAPKPVAAKALHNDAAPAEEAEFLREASTIAGISHKHVVRLVGVCSDMEGPPLLLMDHAFFGDLLNYLRQRRHLAEVNERCPTTPDTPDTPNTTDTTDMPECDMKQDYMLRSRDLEARHVTPMELTRLGREVSDALAYLGENRILHRDVRAANCLIDERRTLKLADFGMARNVQVNIPCILDEPEDSKDGKYKYICRRRCVFPVPWMAPESLDRGEFSHASDVWALGVLMLEIATLGSRPYGPQEPIEVFNYVKAGGKPLLPRDASYHTFEITEKCWSSLATDRPTAREVYDYLTEHPSSLRAALRSAWRDSTLNESDSGFGEAINRIHQLA